MEQKVRFKMHKVKKNWVTIGVTALSMVTVAGGALLADQQVQADEQNPANQSGDSSQDLLQETPATTNDAATTVAPTIAADANTASVNIPVADTTSTTTAVTDRAAAPTTNAATVDTNSGQAAPSTNVQPAAADTSATTTDTTNNTTTATTDRSATTVDEGSHVPKLHTCIFITHQEVGEGITKGIVNRKLCPLSVLVVVRIVGRPSFQV
jgi:KxYKxGKxW signal peptide